MPPVAAPRAGGTDCPERRLYAQESRLFGFSGGLWRERGFGDAIMLKDVKTERVRFVFRRSETREILANHYVIEHETYCCLRRNVGNEDSWVWSARDRAEEKPRVQRFALKLATLPLAESFKECFDHAKELNAKAEGFAEEQELYAQKSVLYTFHGAAWRDTGYGKAWILRHGRTGRSRFVFKREEKNQIVANHYIAHHGTDCELRPNAGSADCWAWAATDLTGDAARHQRFALRFVSSDLAAAFKSHFDRAKGDGGPPALTPQAAEEEMYAQGSCRLYLFGNDAWKDQGAGAAKLLKDTGTGRRRFAFLSAGAAELVASHDVVGHGGHCNLKPNAGSNDCWAWSVEDRVQGVRRFALKFHGPDAAAKFRVAFDAAKDLGSRAAGVAAAVGRSGGEGPAAEHSDDAVGFTLVRSDKGGAREHFVLRPGPAGGAVQIGRSPLSEVRVALNGVSNLHAELRAADLGGGSPLCVRDLSRNGTALQLPSGKKVLLKKGGRTSMPHGATLMLPMMTRSSAKRSGLIQVYLTLELDKPEIASTTAPVRKAPPPVALEPTTKTRTKAAPARPPQRAPLPPPMGQSALYTGLEGDDRRSNSAEKSRAAGARSQQAGAELEGHDRRSNSVEKSRAVGARSRQAGAGLEGHDQRSNSVEKSRVVGARSRQAGAGLEGHDQGSNSVENSQVVGARSRLAAGAGLEGHDQRSNPVENSRVVGARSRQAGAGLEGDDRRSNSAQKSRAVGARSRQAALRPPILIPFSTRRDGKRQRRDEEDSDDEMVRRLQRAYDGSDDDMARGRGKRLRRGDAWDPR